LAPFTVEVLNEKSIPVGEAFPKSIPEAMTAPVDLIVNLSGERLPKMLAPLILDWTVPDPMGQKIDAYRTAAARIESLVMQLVLDLRAGRILAKAERSASEPPSSAPPAGSA
jgi:protein-tyrosine-phosphatase